MAEIDGFYTAYMSGKEAEGFAMFVLTNGTIVGADPTGTTFDGTYQKIPDGTGYAGNIAVKLPPDGRAIQGANSGPDGLEYRVQLNLPGDLSGSEFVRIETPLGPVNARFVKVRGINA